MSGVVFTPAAADRIGRAVRWAEAQRQAGREPAGPGRGVEPVWARVTSGTADGDGYYPGVITLRAGDDGSWSDYSAVKVGPLNGETLSNATRYAVRPSGRTSAGDELYTVIGATVAAASADVVVVRPTSTGTESSTAYVQEWGVGGDWADTATTVTAVISSGGGGATTPVFDSTSIRYLAVRLGSSYYIPAAYASATSSGWVNTTTQTLAGNKTLNGYLTVDHRAGTHARLDDDCDVVVGATAGTGAANSGFEAKSDATNGDTAYFKVETDAPAGNANLSGAVLRHGSVYGYTDLYTQSSAGGVNLAILAGWNDLGGGTITFDSPKYAVLDEDQTLHVGVYGTLADGSVVKGGIVTSAGSTIDGGTW